MSDPVILAAKRLPIGRFLGALSRVPSPQLGAYAIQAVLEEVPSAKPHVDECIMGCVLQAGLGQNPARQSGLKAGLPDTLSAQTINKVCGSGLQSVMLAAQSIKAADNALVVAGARVPPSTMIRNGGTPPRSKNSMLCSSAFLDPTTLGVCCIHLGTP